MPHDVGTLVDAAFHARRALDRLRLLLTPEVVRDYVRGLDAALPWLASVAWTYDFDVASEVAVGDVVVTAVDGWRHRFPAPWLDDDPESGDRDEVRLAELAPLLALLRREGRLVYNAIRPDGRDRVAFRYEAEADHG